MIPFIRIKRKRNLGDIIPQQLNFLYGEDVPSIFIKLDLLSIRKDPHKYLFFIQISLYINEISNIFFI
jgi:hypothetical protein